MLIHAVAFSSFTRSPVRNTTATTNLSRREFKGQQDREPLRGKSASERVSEREGFQRFSELFQTYFRNVSEADFLSEALSPVAPNRVALELSPTEC